MSLFAIFCTVALPLSVFGAGVATPKWNIDWRSSDLNLIPPLPIAAPNAANPQCRRDSMRLMEALSNMTLWAEQSKYPPDKILLSPCR
ncbi:hypothetical protein M8J75_010349 [Diaphorina citri]|nr:hypothetical protein M8J75_010349 [Diaphorina citri]